MKRINKKWSWSKIKACLFVFVIIFVPVFTACSNTQPSQTDVSEDIYEIELSAYEKTVFAGESIQLEVHPSNTEGATEHEIGTILWSTSDSKIATVNEDGLVSGVSEGTATITASLADHPEIVTKAEITVGEHVSSVQVDIDTVELLAGTNKADAVIHGWVVPENALIQGISYMSSDESVVTVDDTGSIHAVAPGKATITISSSDDACKESATCLVTVSQGVNEIKLSEENLSLYYGEEATLTATVFPENATVRDVTWSSSNEDVCVVSEEGSITTVGSGKAEIICSSVDGSEVVSVCPVEVIVGVDSLEISRKKATLLLGASEAHEQVMLSCTTVPENATYQKVTWSSSDETIAVVDENGTVTGIGSGKAIITATTTDPRSGDLVSTSCTVTVGNAVREIQISGKKRIVVGKTAQLKATVLPGTALKTAVEWSSSDTKILTVDADGKVHTKKTGTVTVTCTAKDGSGTIATHKITVYQPVTKLTPSTKKTIVLFGGQTITLKTKASPKDASDKKVTWKSSNKSVATVNEKGVVTAVGKGTATITATTVDGSKLSCKFSIRVEPANPIEIVNGGFGVYEQDLFSITVKNNCATKTIVNFTFDLSLNSYTNERLVTSGTYDLGNKVSIGPGAKREILRTHAGISATYQMKIVITEIEFSDKTTYSIPWDEQIEWTITRQ